MYGLSNLGKKMGCNTQLVTRLHLTGAIPGKNEGPGRNRGIVLTKSEALTAGIILYLRAEGLPNKFLAPVAQQLNNGCDGNDVAVTLDTGLTVLINLSQARRRAILLMEDMNEV